MRKTSVLQRTARRSQVAGRWGLCAIYAYPNGKAVLKEDVSLRHLNGWMLKAPDAYYILQFRRRVLK